MNKYTDNIGAIFDPTHTFRYALWRIWDRSKPCVMFVGLNPSTANETTDDPTIRRVKGFAKAWGFGGVFMVNCFPLVSSDPTALDYYMLRFDGADIVHNDRHIMEAYTMMCNRVVFAWGAFDIVNLSGRDEQMKKMFPDARALILNKNGSPRHPLYVPLKTETVIYSTQL
jgi:hypothetical protein